MFKDLKLDFPALLTLLITVAFIAIIAISAFTPLKADPNLIQVLVAVVTLSWGYYFGSSTGSKSKDAALLPPLAGPAAPVDASPLKSVGDIAAGAAKVAGMLLALVIVSSLFSIDQAAAQVRKPVLTGNVVNDINRAREPGIAAGTDIKLTGDPVADLHAAVTKGGEKLIMHLKQAYALATAKAPNGVAADNTLAVCVKALVPIVSLIVIGPPEGTLAPGDSMALTDAEVKMAGNTGEPEGPIVKIEKLRILRLALNSPALNDACGALVQDEIKQAQGLVGKITSIITGVGLLPVGL